MEILPGVHRIDNVRGANSYLIVAGKSAILIDTGVSGNSGKILSYIQGLGITPRDVKYIILTHADTDHTGNVLKLNKITGAQVAAHEYEIQNLHGGCGSSSSRNLLGLLARMRFLRFHPIHVDIMLKDGDTIAGLKVIYTPGHTRGSICLYRAPDVLFSGDIVRVGRKNNPQFSAKAFTWDVGQAYQSVQKISELPFDVLLPGHGEPIIKDSVKKLKELLQANRAESLNGFPR